MLKVLDLFGEGFGGIVGIDGHFCLKDGLAVVIKIVNEMDGDPAFLFACCDDRFVYMPAVHSFSAIFGEEGRVDINDPVGISLHQPGGDLPQKARQHDEVDLVFLKFGEVGVPAEELFLFDQQDRDAGCRGDVEYAGVGVIADDKMDGYERVIPEMVNDPGGVGTCSGRKNGELIHEPKTTAGRMKQRPKFSDAGG
jgi:hypothetical protein